MSRWPTKVVLALLRLYKLAVSPWLSPACRFVPTCSDYATEAVERHGVLWGCCMAMQRLLRCHPLANGGYDPVSQMDRRGRNNLSAVTAPTE